MTREELENKCKERAKIFQQAMESCKSSSPIDCIEQFADRIAELEKENAELKKKNLGAQDAVTMQMYTNRANKEIADKQLTKAKEIIKKFSEFANLEIEYDPEHPQEHTDLWNELCEKAEQFLNCSEKPNN